ncbi:MAG: hypothetical protein ACJA0Q_001124 [Saprospiraceae bacterium]|jgi:hypothetical protein
MKSKILIAVLIAGILSSCLVSKEKLLGVEKVAFVSVMLKKEIDMSEFSSFASMVSALVQDDDFDLEPITNKMKDKI